MGRYSFRTLGLYMPCTARNSDFSQLVVVLILVSRTASLNQRRLIWVVHKFRRTMETSGVSDHGKVGTMMAPSVVLSWNSVAREVLRDAVSLAASDGRDAVWSGDLLRALLGKPELFVPLCDLETVRSMQEAAKQLAGRETYFAPVERDGPRLSNESKRIAAYAAEEADATGSALVAPQHLLIGFLREETMAATGVLLGGGLSVEGLRRAVGGSGAETR